MAYGAEMKTYLALSLLLVVTFGPSLAARAESAAKSKPIPPVCITASEAAEPEQAVAAWTECIDADVDELVKAQAFYNRGVNQMRLNKPRKAVDDYTEAAKTLRDDADVYTNRGYASLVLGYFEQAEGDFTRALAFAPDDADAYANRAVARVEMIRFEDAVMDFESAVRKDPAHLNALRGLTFLLAACEDKTLRNGQRAVETGIMLVALEQTADNLDTLAAAHAEAEQFEQAVKVEQEAIAMARDEGLNTERFEANLDRYRQGKTYR